MSVETFQKRSHHVNGFHSQTYAMTQDLWEDHCGAYFILSRNYGVKDGCFYFHFRRGSKNKDPATGARLLGCLKKLVYDWLLQKVTASRLRA